MLILLVAKRKLHPFFTAHQTLIPIPLRCCYSSASTAIQSPAAAIAAADPKPPNFLADHLITSWGFSPNQAAIVSRRLPNLKTTDKPDAVLRFLTNNGFAKPDIGTIVSWQPKLLYSSPDNTLAPNLSALRNIGLSTSALTRIILSGPTALYLCSALPRINFWRDFLGDSDEATLVRVFTQNRGLIGRDITNSIAPKISFLRGQGFSTHDIQRIVRTVNMFMTRNIASMENLITRAKELGFRIESGGMFVVALQALTSATREELQKKKELFKSFGWSEDEFLSALLKGPGILKFSEENLRVKVDFLVGQVGCEPSYIASHHKLLTFSLEKRLRPRHHILHLLESKGLVSGKRPGFYSVIKLSDLKFVDRYILPHREEIPELHEVYLAAIASLSLTKFWETECSLSSFPLRHKRLAAGLS